ncbi:uncharacterized protein TNCV_2209301 [Trichonephila clavipes]|nr:uncharacterized protein TNCV_2209301 [Trichonephila clavipes]
MLYNIYTHDFPTTPTVDVCLFADDAAIIAQEPSMSSLFFGQEIGDFISMNVNMGRDPQKVDVSIFCYGFELIDYSNAQEVLHTSPVLQMLNGATAICEDPNVARVSFVEDGL